MGGRGATAFVRKAIEQQRKGKLSVIVLPVFDYVTRLLERRALRYGHWDECHSTTWIADGLLRNPPTSPA